MAKAKMKKLQYLLTMESFVIIEKLMIAKLYPYKILGNRFMSYSGKKS